jgi:N-acylneuraminate cytidylyltransferase
MSTGGDLAMIPARVGSRRVPRKNIREMHARPLLAYSIDGAVATGLFARVVVSTDDAEIADVARTAGADVPFLRVPRPGRPRDAGVATIDVVDRLEAAGEAYREVCQLMPNCPLRIADDVVASHRQCTERPAEAQISVARYGWQSPWWAMRRGADGTLDPVFPNEMQRRSQDLPELVCPTGAVGGRGRTRCAARGRFAFPAGPAGRSTGRMRWTSIPRTTGRWRRR